MGKRVALLYGGTSGERRVSLDSAAAVKTSLEKRYEVCAFDTASDDWPLELLNSAVDGVFICLHGGTGEDGSIQGFCESLNLPYTGSGVFASSAAMNKAIAKHIVGRAGVSTPESLMVSDADDDIVSGILTRFGGKVVVKPSAEGSALGVFIVDNKLALIDAIKSAQEFSACVLVEKFIAGRELTVAVLGGSVPKALPVIEIVPVNKFYDYDSKYVPGMAEHICPAKLTKEQAKACQDMAIIAHESLGCYGVSRTDCILDQDGKVWYLETNTIPGMTKTSLLPEAVEAVGISFDQLCWGLMEDAWIRE